MDTFNNKINISILSCYVYSAYSSIWSEIYEGKCLPHVGSDPDHKPLLSVQCIVRLPSICVCPIWQVYVTLQDRWEYQWFFIPRMHELNLSTIPPRGIEPGTSSMLPSSIPCGDCNSNFTTIPPQGIKPGTSSMLEVPGWIPCQDCNYNCSRVTLAFERHSFPNFRDQVTADVWCSNRLS